GMAGVGGIEPPTCGFGDRCSTTELHIPSYRSAPERLKIVALTTFPDSMNLIFSLLALVLTL
ncbi:unnamed protein product, partial [marine sediment metagenome]